MFILILWLSGIEQLVYTHMWMIVSIILVKMKPDICLKSLNTILDNDSGPMYHYRFNIKVKSFIYDCIGGLILTIMSGIISSICLSFLLICFCYYYHL